MRLTFAYLCLMLLWSLSLKGQPTSNPFEVANRIENGTKPSSIQTYLENNDTTIVGTDTTRLTNPFEVNHVPMRKTKRIGISTGTPIHEISKVKPKISNQFVFGIMFFSWALLALVITSKTSLLSYLLRSVFNINMMKLTKRDETSSNSFLLTLLYIVFLINFSIFIYLLQKQFTAQEGTKIWLICFGLITGVYLVRHLAMWLLGQIFPVEKESSLYNYVIVVFNIMFGICIIPLNLMLKFGPENLIKPMFVIGLALFALYYLVRNLRGLTISIYLIGQGLVSFFIYLCVFEIAPILVIIRAILNIKGI